MKENIHFGLSPGNVYKQFKVLSIKPIPEIQNTLIELVHETNGAQVLHLANQDDENLFSLSFRTFPENSKGIPHILEHTVLCGSKKFPVKDPFFSMLRRSLNTFMNAMTGSDFTCYPASSQIEKDFYNLFEVYLDAVFYPELKKVSFLQEGCRLEFTDPKDPTTSLVYKGVVFNEMKGSLTSPETRLWYLIMKNLLPNLPYAYNSGGDPKEIVHLSYEELVAFHRNYYHPSKCLFFFYGNLSLQKHIDFIDAHVFSKKQEPSVRKTVSLQKQPRFFHPVECFSRYPIPKGEKTQKQSLISFSWLTCSPENQEETLALSLIDSILMDTDVSPLKYALLQSGLCSEVEAALDLEMSEIPWVLICKGCDVKDKDKLLQVVRETLQAIVKEGFSKDLIEASFQQLEFSRTEITGGKAPYGLTLFMRAALAKQHGCKPEEALEIHLFFQKLFQKLENDPKYLGTLIEKYFLNNPHCVHGMMEPDPKLEQEEQKEEKEALKKEQKNLSPEKIKKILSETEELERYQKEIQTQSLDCLPKISPEEIPTTIKDYALKEEKMGSFQVFHHPVFTNKILYADLVFPLPDLTEEELRYLPLLALFLSEVGTEKKPYGERLKEIHAYTGGIEASVSIRNPIEDHKRCQPVFVIRGKALDRHREKLFCLLKESFSVHFREKERMRELLLQEYTEQSNSLNKQAMHYAIRLSLADFSLSSYIENLWHGVEYFKTLRDLASHLDKKFLKFLEKLEELKEKILLVEPAHLILSCDEENFRQLKASDFFGLIHLPLQKREAWKDKTFPQGGSQGKIISSPVAFTSMAYSTVGYLHPDAPALLLASALFENLILHKKVREQGGAYGVDATYAPSTGNFYFDSYRDPHLSQTIQIFKEATLELFESSIADKDLEEAKLVILQSLDKPVSPGNRALLAYQWKQVGKTKERREAFREKILHLKEGDVKKALQNQLLPLFGTEKIASFAGQKLLQEENSLMKENSLKISKL